MGTFLRRIWHLLNRGRHERALVREMEDHRGLMSDPSKFGDTHRLLERSRDEWGWNWLDDAVQDLKMGVRSLRRSPGFSITASLILIFGVGLNLTLYQIVNVALLRGPAIREPASLARFYRDTPTWNSSTVPYVLAQAIARDNTALSAVLIESSTTVAWGADASTVTASFVTANWFAELGYTALHGRALDPALDGQDDSPATVVLSHSFWTARLGGDPAVVGTTVRVNDRPVTIAGVMPERFPGLDLDQPDVWMPITQREYYYPDSPLLRAWDADGTTMYGRLKAGVSPAVARDRLRAALAALHREQPQHVAADEWLEPSMATVNFLRPSERFEVRLVMSLIGALSGLVLLVGAANVGNLVLSRSMGRARELGVRVALGARRSRIVRQLVLETLPLGLLGAAGGLLFASWSSSAIAAIAAMPRYLDFTPDWRTLVLSLALGGIALAVAGAIPAWKVAQQDLNDAIKDGGQQVSMRLDRARVRRVMLVAQVAGSCVLLVIATMMARSLQRLLSSDLGFEYEQTAVLQTALGRYGIQGEAARAYWMAVKEQVSAHPETQDVALVLAPPLGSRVHETNYGDAPGVEVISNHVEPGYFALMGIPIIAGRTFEPGDDPAAAVIISRTLALRMYQRADVVGERFPKSTPDAIIVGIAGDAHAIKLGASGVAELYRPLAPADYDQAALLARARRDPDALVPVLRQAATAQAPVMAGARPLRDDFERRMNGRRLASGIAVSIGLVTLLLACLGIFGVVSYGVVLRTREIGIHAALGAGRRSILGLVMRHVWWPVSLGMGIGVAAAVPVGVALSRSPLQLQSTDPVAFAAGLVIFGAAGTVAALWPALEVFRSNPMDALRHS